MSFEFANNVRSVLTAAINASVTSIEIDDALGIYNDFPDPTNGGEAVATLVDNLANPTKIEVVTYTGVTTGAGTHTLTGVTRGAHGTTAQTWLLGETAFQAITEQSLGSAYLDDISLNTLEVRGAGSAGAPAVTLGDANSGFFSPVSGQVGVSLDGVQGASFEPQRSNLHGSNGRKWYRREESDRSRLGYRASSDTVDVDVLTMNTSNYVGINETNPQARVHSQSSSTVAMIRSDMSSGGAINNKVVDLYNSSSSFRIGLEYDDLNINLNLVDRNRSRLVTIREAGTFGWNLGSVQSPIGDFDFRANDEAELDIRLHTANNSADTEPLLRFMRRRGTMAASLDTQDGDDLGAVEWYGYDGGVTAFATLQVEVASQATRESRLRYFGRDDDSFIEQLRIEANSLSFAGQANPFLRLYEAAGVTGTNFAQLQYDGSGTLLAGLVDSGSASISLEARPSDGVSSSFVNFFRSVNTTGAKSLRMFRGDGTAEVDHDFLPGDSGALVRFCQNGGGMKVGGTSATDAQLTNMKCKDSDTSRSSTTTATADPDLSVPVEANSFNRFTLKATVNASSSGDIRTNFTGPAGSTVRWSPTQSSTATTLPNMVSSEAVFQCGNNLESVLHLEGTIEVGGTAGDLEFHWAQGTSNATATIVREGSMLISHRAT